MTALLPFVADHAAEGEAARKPVDEVMDRLHATGVFRHFVPRRYGGLEFGVMDFVDEMLPLGEACASTAWVTVFCMEHNLLVSLYPEAVQDEIFGNQPYVMAPGWRCRRDGPSRWRAATWSPAGGATARV